MTPARQLMSWADDAHSSVAEARQRYDEGEDATLG